jgi:LysR family transcriptional activator of nhaA
MSSPAEFLNYHHLRYFWMVAKEGSLRRAAEALSVSQPSICTQIQLLETALGEDLFRPSGRSLVLTEFGRLIFGYADEIFTLGNEILRATKQAPTSRSIRLNAGVVDSFPKLMSFEILRPIFEHQPPVQLTCHEGKLPDLLAQLSTHRIDVVLADEPASPSTSGKVFNHLLTTSDVSFCAMPSVVAQLKGRFPDNLNGAPALLPTPNCTLRRELENWFRKENITPKVVAEFEDAALTKIVASNELGFIAIPTIILPEAIERNGFVQIGRAKELTTSFYAITVERRLTHPAILALTQRSKTAAKRAKTPVSSADPAEPHPTSGRP